MRPHAPSRRPLARPKSGGWVGALVTPGQRTGAEMGRASEQARVGNCPKSLTRGRGLPLASLGFQTWQKVKSEREQGEEGSPACGGRVRCLDSLPPGRPQAASWGTALSAPPAGWYQGRPHLLRLARQDSPARGQQLLPGERTGTPPGLGYLVGGSRWKVGRHPGCGHQVSLVQQAAGPRGSLGGSGAPGGGQAQAEGSRLCVQSTAAGGQVGSLWLCVSVWSREGRSHG